MNAITLIKLVIKIYIKEERRDRQTLYYNWSNEWVRFCTTNELLQRGAHVTILARNIDKFNRIKENYFKPEHINVIKCDLMQRKDIESLQNF